MVSFSTDFTQLRNRDVSSIFTKFIYWLIAVWLLAGCSSENTGTTSQSTETAIEHSVKHLQVNYICPMHAQIIRDTPASCPICGMDLVKQQKSSVSKPNPAIELSANVVQQLGVKTAAVVKDKLWKYIKTVGYVAYDEQRISVIEAQADGWVENIAVRRAGLPVKKGQLLMELYSPEFLRVQKDFIAAQDKDQSGILKQYGQRQESVDARDQLRYMGISESLANEIARDGKPQFRIPVYTHQHGNIISHNVKKHQYVREGDHLFTVADLSAVWIEADVYEHQLGWVERKQTAEITVQALPGKKWRGQVIYIYPELNPRSRTLRVRIRVPNYDSDLKPNMFAQVEIFGGAADDKLIIPREALIVTGERESVVLDLGDGKFQPVDVVSGMRSHGMVEILSGLEKDQQVVVSGQFLIDSEANLQASFSRLETSRQE